MEKKQTALRWLIKTMSEKHKGFEVYINANKAIIEEALELEKKKMIEFHIDVMKKGLKDEGIRVWQDSYSRIVKQKAEQHFSEAFNPKPPCKE